MPFGLTRRRRSRMLNLTPLIDVLLLLLIFFLVTTTFIESPLVEFNLPRVSEAEPGRLASVALAIDAEGRVFLEGREEDLPSLEHRLKELVGQSPDAALVIKVHRDARYERVLQVITVASQAGFKKIQSPVMTGLKGVR